MHFAAKGTEALLTVSNQWIFQKNYDGYEFGKIQRISWSWIYVIYGYTGLITPGLAVC